MKLKFFSKNKKLKIFSKLVSFSFFILFWFSPFFISSPIETNNYDNFLYKAINFFMVSAIFIPFFILCSKKIKLNLPMFKKKRWWHNLFGSAFIFFICIFLSFITFQFHSSTYKENYKEYFNSKQNNNLSLKRKEELEEVFSQLVSDPENQINFNLSELLKIHYIDVGQGDSTFIELPNKQTMLIDAAEEKEAEKIIQYIQNLNYNSIDYVIATHPHTDHIGGLAKVIDSFKVGAIYMPKAVTTTKTYENLLDTISKNNLKIKKAHKGIFILDQPNFKIEILSPKDQEYSKLNNYSVVLKITYFNRTFLFMGDAEQEIEAEFDNSFRSDVIKVGHHGSDTSSSKSFIEHLQPKYAIISVGENNKYNHPSSNVLQILESISAEILRTDYYGNIILSSDGDKIMVQTENGDYNNNSDSSHNQNTINDQNKTNEIQIINFTDHVKAGKNASIQIQGSPNTLYHIEVIYTEKSNAKGLESKSTDENGSVTWSWKVGNNTFPGSYKIKISNDNCSKELLFYVE